MSIFRDNVWCTTQSQGTGAKTLLDPVVGARSVGAALASGTTVAGPGGGPMIMLTIRSAVEDGQFETGIYEYSAGANTITPLTIFESSNGNAAVDWGSGTRNVFCAPAAAYLGGLRCDHKGSAAPARPQAGMRWLDDSASPWVLKQHDGTDWLGVLRIDPTNNRVEAVRSAATVASAATVDLGAIVADTVAITGTTTITSFGIAPEGTPRDLIFAGALTLTHHASSLILPGAASISTAAGDAARAVSLGAGNWRVTSYARASGLPVVSPEPPAGYLYGLGLSANATDPQNDIDIAAGECSSDTSRRVTMVLAATLTKRLDAAWAAGTGNGGLDTGSKQPNTLYHAFLIANTNTGAVDAILSASQTSPTLPAGWTAKRWLGARLTDASGALQGDAGLSVEPGGRLVYQSLLQAVSSGTQVALTHYLGARPKLVAYTLVFKVAEANYSVGDHVPVDCNNTMASLSTFNTGRTTATQILVRFSDNAKCFTVGNANTGAYAQLNNSSVDLVVRAWA